VKWGEAKRRKPTQGKKVDESCPGPGGKNIQQGSYCRKALGNVTAFTGWIMRLEVEAHSRAVN